MMFTKECNVYGLLDNDVLRFFLFIYHYIINILNIILIIKNKKMHNIINISKKFDKVQLQKMTRA